MNPGARWVVAALILVFGGVVATSDLGFALRGGTVGANFVNGVVTDVLPGSPAARAGIRVGDRADLQAADLPARMFIARDILMTQGERLGVPVQSSYGEVTRRITAMPTTPAGRSQLLESALTAVACALLAAWVVLGCGTISGYSLAVFALGELQISLLDVFGPLTLPLCTFINIIAALAPLALLTFALHAADERLSRPRMILQVIAILATVPLLAATVSETLVSVIVPGYTLEIDTRYLLYAPFS